MGLTIEQYMSMSNAEAFDWLRNEVARLEKENAELRLVIMGMRESIASVPAAVKLDASAYAPELPTGQPVFWFNDHTGPYKADDTFGERACRWSHGPFTSWNEANDAWKEYIKRQRENGQP